MDSPAPARETFPRHDANKIRSYPLVRFAEGIR
jgi:hypothetical protein